MVENEYTRNEFISEFENRTGKELTVSAFYRWLPFCLVAKKNYYTKKDLEKFVFVFEELKKVRSMKTASERLEQRLERYPEEFE